jgi:hypothetical protein
MALVFKCDKPWALSSFPPPTKILFDANQDTWNTLLTIPRIVNNMKESFFCYYPFVEKEHHLPQE